MAIIRGTEGDDREPFELEGTNLADEIFGLGGNDTLVGREGDDVLEGGAGADELFGGGAGLDLASYRGSNQGVFIDLGLGIALSGHAEGDKLFSIEGVIGSAFGDIMQTSAAGGVLRGLAGGDDLFGLAGNDRIEGGGDSDGLSGGDGNDTLSGGSGNDFVRGQAGNDTVNGGSGNDVVDGGAGTDRLAGQSGADQFDFDLQDDSRPEAPDRILDFSLAQGDKIDLVDLDANEQVAGNQAFQFIGRGQFTGAGQLRFFQQDGDTIVAGNMTDLTAGAELRIVLDPMVTLQASDFVLWSAVIRCGGRSRTGTSMLSLPHRLGSSSTVRIVSRSSPPSSS